MPVTVRVPENLLRQIDKCIEDQEVPISRNNWLLEAAVEKLHRARNGESNNGS
jgi:metal-responsive CopG/Arc/MetJ family transcriptional regulator